MARSYKRRQQHSKEDSDTPRKGDKSKQHRGTITTRNRNRNETKQDIPTTPPKTNDNDGNDARKCRDNGDTASMQSVIVVDNDPESNEIAPRKLDSTLEKAARSPTKKKDEVRTSSKDTHDGIKDTPVSPAKSIQSISSTSSVDTEQIVKGLKSYQESNKNRKKTSPTKLNAPPIILPMSTDNGNNNNTQHNDIPTPMDTSIPFKVTDFTKEQRFQVIISIPPTKTPWTNFTTSLREFLKFIHEQVHEDIYIGPWESDSDAKPIKQPKDFPEGLVKNRPLYAEYFSGYPNPKSPNKGNESKVFLKVRFIMDEPDKLPFPLHDLGKEIGQDLPQELHVFLKNQPYACQAPTTETIGWLWGSTKHIDSTTFINQVKKELNIPDHVAIGVQWRTIKDQHKKLYSWEGNDQPNPPQALHLDIDKNYANLYTEKAATLWKKSAKKRVNGKRYLKSNLRYHCFLLSL